MKPRKLSTVAAVTGGRLKGEDVEVTSVAVDSRESGAGTLFFALPGERADGHDFAMEAIARGAAAVVSNPAAASEGAPAVVVADTLRALGDLAADERRSSSVRVAGITGSTGKTMTKDLVAAVLAARYGVRASPGSFNNEIGLPLTLLGAAADDEVVVAEMGARRAGHIAALCRIADPDLGIVTNVGVAHMGLFGSQENIANAKAELVEALGAGGTAVLAADDPVVRGFAARTRAEVLTFGLAENALVRAEDVELGDEGCARFTLVAAGARETVELGVPGAHMVQNALAASAAGIAFGLSLAEIAATLKDAKVSSWRMETFTTETGVRVINDAYNANPQSMAAALKTARWIARDARLCAVLGTMRELGSISLEEHERVGELAARLGVDRLITVGGEAEPIARAAVREGVEPENVASFEDSAGALTDVLAWAGPRDVVLFKASRVVGLEELAEAMR